VADLLVRRIRIALCIERWRHYKKQEQAVDHGLELIPAFAENPAGDFRDRFGNESAVARLAGIP
jgi:hypothetical protein